MINRIDQFLNKITMYRLLIYYLGGLLAVALILSTFGNLGFNPLALVASTTILITACWGINSIFACIFKVTTNHESSIITALILALIITPSLDLYGILFPLVASGLAMASKYLVTIRGVHIFNPAAIAVVLTAFGPEQNATWWVGSAVMVPFVIVGGLLLIRKIRRAQMVTSLLIAAFAATAFFAALDHNNILIEIGRAAFASQIFFLGFVMLTEPVTSPSTKIKQTWYGILVGLLMPPQIHIFNLYSSPELALVIGNLFSRIIDPRFRIFPVLRQKLNTATNTIDFIFTANKKLAYQPGQYMEWTLPHNHIDNRGNRRYFTIASSPTEPTLRLGIKFYTPSSSYKKTLMRITKSSRITAAHVVGDFVMPRRKDQKLVFIAGGIGITPFRSMIKYLIDNNEQRDIKLIYAADSKKGMAYTDLLAEAERQLGITTTYVLANPGPNQNLAPNERPGHIDTAIIQSLAPDYMSRTFYISGSHQMVIAIKRILIDLGIPRRHIKTDYFPGYI